MSTLLICDTNQIAHDASLNSVSEWALCFSRFRWLSICRLKNFLFTYCLLYVI